MHLLRPVLCSTLALVLSATTGCVTTGTHKQKIAELDKLRADDKAAHDKRESDLKSSIALLESQLKATSDKLAQAEKDRDNSTALAGELKGRLEKLGQNVEKLTSEKGQLSQTLADAKARLEEMRKQKAAAEARAATFRGLMEKLRSMIDSGQLKVIIRDGRMLIALPNDVLFDSGKTALKADGQAALGNVAQVLASIPDRKYIVAGNTDDVRIKNEKFPSNWELSTARAVEVTKLLIARGMKPQTLAAAGYGEFDPVVPNDTPEHRAQNRRIEIVLQPNLADLPSLEGLDK